MAQESLQLSRPEASVLTTVEPQRELSLSDIAVATKLAPSEVRQIVARLEEAELVKSGPRGPRLTREGMRVRQDFDGRWLRPRALENESYENVSAELDAELAKLGEP
ncbi:MAG TPA: MarR family transcriptional regulator [Thermoanaerobaculia bacterium]|jgi:DNA-binding IclR family transcriptional regulator|nr:MarR family transcriptional regulator [Thermoanaerobaculia bacterium]